MKIFIKHSPNFEEKKKRHIKYIILHYTNLPSTQASLKYLLNKRNKVSAHYLIDPNGKILSLVEEKNIAWHAGISSWKKDKNLNKNSIGIELQNTGVAGKYEKFNVKQIAVLEKLIKDIQMRHGVSTTHNKFDMPLAILAGDVLYSKAYHTISSKSKLSPNHTTQLVTKLSKACVEICEGQVDDVKLAENKRIPTEKEYIKMIEKKTAVLFEVSCAMGAICAKRKEKDVKNLSTFGRNLGIAFQITDDLIGIMGDSKVTKKPVGNDIREGKKSLPILLAIRKARGNDKKKILKVFGKSKAAKKDVQTAVNTIRSLGIEEEVRKKALQYATKATKSLDSYSGNDKKEMLSLLDFVVKRSI